MRIEASHNVANIKSLLKNICENCIHILPNPDIKILLSQMIDSGGVELKLLYWSKSDLDAVRDEVLTVIKTTFERESITFVPASKN